MEKKHNHAVLISVLVFMLLVVGMFGFAYLKNAEKEMTVTDQTDTSDTNTPDDDRYGYIERIDGKHFYIDGVHTIVGEIPMPTPCDLLDSKVIVAESFPEQVTLDFSVINNADTCTQVITPARFKVSAEVSENATFSARFNGRSVELNLVPAAEGETPDEFELFIKG